MSRPRTDANGDTYAPEDVLDAEELADHYAAHGIVWWKE